MNNNKKLKDDNNYYYLIINKNELPEVSNFPKDTDMKEIYNKVKGDMSIIPGDQNDDLLLNKVPPNKDVKDVLRPLKNRGDLIIKEGEEPTEPKGQRQRPGDWEEPSEDERCTKVQFIKFWGDESNKQIQIKNQNNILKYLTFSK